MAIRVGDPTYYEIVVTDGTTSARIPCWSYAHGRTHIRKIAGDHFERIVAFTGESDFEWNSKAQAFVGKNWRIKWSGRTQREAQGSPLPVLPKLETANAR